MIDNVRDDLTRRADTARSELGDLIWLLRMAVFGAVAGAVYTELRKPPDQRTWHGKLLGFVPYDFRMPSLEQLRSAPTGTRTRRRSSPIARSASAGPSTSPPC